MKAIDRRPQAGSAEEFPMARISILDPTAPPPNANPDPGPAFDATGLANSHFGIRYDLTWRSFDWVRDEWQQMLSQEGAVVSDWCAGDRTGEAAATTLAELERFAGEQEVVLSGLGN
jgi:hypothetical protein